MLMKFLLPFSKHERRVFDLAAKSFSTQQKEALKQFIAKNAKINYLGDFILKKYDDLPIIVHHSFSKSSKALIGSKDLVYDEILRRILEDLHVTKINGNTSCVPGGINAMSKIFNDKFFYKGLF